MEWNPASVTPAHHLPGSLTVPSSHHQQLHHVQQPTTMSSALSSRGVSRGGGVVGSNSMEQADDADDRRPNTPRNSSPVVLAPDFGDESLVDENHDDLLVFGYGCKIFRDDERAQWIEDQKHLIPWMGNSDLLVDRYDCRGALMDISRYEAGSGYDNSLDPSEDGSDDLNRSYEQEQMLEQELDEERYKELNEDVDYDEGAFDRAGDYKRLQTAMNGMLSESQERKNADTKNYAAFEYNYNEQSHDICIGPEPKRLHDEDAAYVKPVGLYIPEEIILPVTMKVHAIIEKTAKFIASQGNQMEIILKTKQSSNPLFDFLNHGGSLNPYYKFLVHAIRSGIYRPPEQDDDSSEANQGLASEYSGSEEDSEHHTYLHPSLFRTSNISSASALSSIDYAAAAVISGSSSSSRNNAYSMLVSKIKGTDSPDPISQQQPISNTPLTAEYLSYQDSNSSNQNVYSMYGYKLSSQQTQSTTVPKPQKKLPSTPDQLIIEKMASYVIKNGANFEVLAKNKSDPRFGFLNPTHEYHWYYLNCKERFKAECTAVVASSEFINYNSSTSSSSNPAINIGSMINSAKSNSTPTNPTSSTIKKSAVAAELAELKRKNSSALSGKKEASKEKVSSVIGGAETVFSQASLVQNKEKDKPVIRFSTSLSLNSVSTPLAVGGTSDKTETKANATTIDLPASPALEIIASKDQETASHENSSVVVTGCTANATEDDEEEEGEIREADGDSDSDLCLLDDDPSVTGGNSTPVSEDDEEKIKRRMERKRKAALFLQKLKMSKTSTGSIHNPSSVTSSKKHSSAHVPSSLKSTQKPVKTGPSLGDLLNRRLQTTVEAAAANQEKIISAHVPPEITLSDSEDNERKEGRAGVGIETAGNSRITDSGKSSPSSRHSSRSRSKGHAPSSSSSRTSRKRRKRRRSRSYSSSHSPSRSSSSTSSYDSSSHSRKKSSKKKRKKKKKKHEKSSRSSHKSKRR